MSERQPRPNTQLSLQRNCARLEAAWRRFLDTKTQETETRDIIMQSWSRCADRGIDALHHRTPFSMRADDVREYQNGSSLFEEVKPVLSSLTSSAFDSKHLLVFCDAAGNIVYQHGESWLQRRADAMNFVTGSSWHEAAAGTNAIGTAIATKCAVDVFASEHYCYGVHAWTCSAAPILDPATDEVLGVIDLTGLWESFHPHTLAVVVTAARLVRQRLQSILELDRFRLLERYIRETSGSRDGVAVFDRGLRVVRATSIFQDNRLIDKDGRLINCPIQTLDALHNSGGAGWELPMPGGKRLVFKGEASYEHGRAAGVIVRIVNDGSHTFSRSQEPAHSSIISRHSAKTRYDFSSLVGHSASFQTAIAAARNAGSELAVLIHGETGTGKELIAQAIHAASRRAMGPFVAINCAAIPHELAAAELFGFEPGAFTGAAKEGRIGKFEQANGGTIFLDEIGDMSLDLQVLLLRVLEERELTRVGGRKTIPIDVRVIAATNQELLPAMELRTFRKDLFYRLNVIPIHVPSLRERSDDVEELLKHFLVQASHGCHDLPVQIDSEALMILRKYSWPGNIRELKNIAERLSTLQSATIRIKDLPQELRTPALPRTGANRHGGRLKLQETEIIRTTLEQCTGNVAETARRLGINRSTIYRRLAPLPKGRAEISRSRVLSRA